MHYAVEVFFDRKSEESIWNMWKALHDSGISSYMYTSGSRPHITLSILNTMDILEFSQKL